MSLPSWFKGEIHPGDTGPHVNTLRRILGLPPGPYDEDAIQRVRGVQMARKARVTGVIDKATARAIGESASAGFAPTWFQRDLQLWFEGEDVRVARKLLGLPGDDNRYDPDAETAVRRLQSAHGIDPTGILGFDESKILGDI